MMGWSALQSGKNALALPVLGKKPAGETAPGRKGKRISPIRERRQNRNNPNVHFGEQDQRRRPGSEKTGVPQSELTPATDLMSRTRISCVILLSLCRCSKYFSARF